MLAWDKLIGHYLNYKDQNASHDNQIRFEERYGINSINNQANSSDNDNDFTYKQLIAGKNHLFKHQSKDRKIANALTKIRNLENIIYLTEEQIESCKTSLDLQLMIDSVIPKPFKLSDEEYVNKLYEKLDKLKLNIENRKYFRSEKERFLGLPFMMERHKQYPEPALNTWQYNLFKDLVGHDYYLYKNVPEAEEKVNKFNYEKFLHTSIIEKYNDGNNIYKNI